MPESNKCRHRAVGARRSGALPRALALALNLLFSVLIGGASSTGVAQLSAKPAGITFGRVVLGGHSTLPLVLFDTGTASVTISRVIITGKGFTASGLRLPLTLAPGQNRTLSVTFAPTSAGFATGSISIVSNAPTSPITVSISGAGTHAVDLAWRASASFVAGYNVYRGSRPGGPYTRLNSSLVMGTTYTDATVQGGLTYYYVTTALSARGVQSAYSNELEATVPSDALPVSPWR